MQEGKEIAGKQQLAEQYLRDAGQTLSRVKKELDEGKNIIEWYVAVPAADVPAANGRDGKSGQKGFIWLNRFLNAALLLMAFKLFYDMIFGGNLPVSLFSAIIIIYAAKGFYRFRRRWGNGQGHASPCLSVCRIVVNFDKKYFDIETDSETDLRDRLHKFQPDTELPAFNLPADDADRQWLRLRDEVQGEIGRRTQCCFVSKAP